MNRSIYLVRYIQIHSSHYKTSLDNFKLLEFKLPTSDKLCDKLCDKFCAVSMTNADCASLVILFDLCSKCTKKNLSTLRVRSLADELSST